MRPSPKLPIAAGLVAGLLACALVRPLAAQTPGATFGNIVHFGGTPSDIVLDELRGRLYLVISAANRVDVYDYKAQRKDRSIQVGATPVAAAMSMDNAFLYVTNNASATVSVIDLGTSSVIRTVSLPARPEGVEVGSDGRVLITTQGTGVNSSLNTLLLYDGAQSPSQQVTAVQFPPPPPTPTTLPVVFTTRPLTTFRGKLIRTPDGKFIAGLTTFNNNTTTYVFVYEVESGVILRSRTVGGQSTVLSMAPDGSRFMAGFTLYDTATLNVIAQQNTSNAPFPLPGAFSTLQNVGGSVFTPDGGTLYSAFNTAAFTQPPPRPQSSILLISHSRHLGIRLGIKIPESIIAKMVMTASGDDAWGLSESGLIHLPLSTLYDYPILQPESNTVFLAVDPCNRGLASAKLRINNLGKGNLTFNVPNTGAALVWQVSSGVAPSDITFVMEPGRAGVVRQPGTNMWTGAGTNNGTPVNIDLVSPNAINIPNRIRVLMNYREQDQRGVIYPLPMGLNQNEALWDLVLDEGRGKLYITNPSFNRIEVFDTKKQRFLDPIDAGQLPHQMAMSSDGSRLFVGNTGGESISIVDLDENRVIGNLEFPPIPRNATAAPVFPRTLAMGLSGLQFLMSNGTLWKVVGGQAVPRQPSAVVGVNAQGRQTPIGSPQNMMATPDGEAIVVLGIQSNRGVGFLYDALYDEFTSSRSLFTAPIQSYFGPLAAAPKGGYYLINGLILNPSLTVIGGAERPGTQQVTQPGQQGQPPVVTVVSAGQRNIAAVAALDENRFVRLTTPVRNNINTTQTRDDIRPTLEQVDLRTGSEALVAVAAENPNLSVFGTQRRDVPPRQMVVDSKGTVYAITLSGLSVISIAPNNTNTRPQITAGVRGVVNSNDGTQNIKPGSFITVRGSNLAQPATSEQIPLPTILGGSCVVFNDVPLPLIQTSADQMSAQIPENVWPGLNVVQVRSLSTGQASDPIVVTVRKP